MFKKILFKWLQLGIGIFGIWLILWLTPKLASSTVHQFIEVQHIHTDALFYTESPEVGAIEFEREKQGCCSKHQIVE